MTSPSPLPEHLEHLVNLAADATGSFVLATTDEYFAPCESLLRTRPAEWREGVYTDRGKWMDGWESQRRRTPGHDHCTIRLGTPGAIHALVVDTTHFKGNAPAQVALEVASASDHADPETLAGAAWREVLAPTPVKPDSVNIIELGAASPRATHVRFHIFPDGGVARLRVLGVVEPEPRTFWQGSIDLAAIEHGGRIALASDRFFGPPVNLLLPGRGVDMGDGWETRRRRTPGSDWCVIRLGRRGILDRIELDTHFFKGNAPQATMIEALDDEQPSAATLAGSDGYQVLVTRTTLVQHRRHVLPVERPLPATHLRVHIYPHGGVNRLRAFGGATPTPRENAKMATLDALPGDAARAVFRDACGSPGFVEAMTAGRPYRTVPALLAAARTTWWSLAANEWLAAFAAHPRIGDRHAASGASAKSAAWSQSEQAGMSAASESLAERMRALNDAYFERFGFIFICFASGRSAREMLTLLEERLLHTRDAEIVEAAIEQSKITRRRLEAWVLDPA